MQNNFSDRFGHFGVYLVGAAPCQWLFGLWTLGSTVRLVMHECAVVRNSAVAQGRSSAHPANTDKNCARILLHRGKWPEGGEEAQQLEAARGAAILPIIIITIIIIIKYYYYYYHYYYYYLPILGRPEGDEEAQQLEAARVNNKPTNANRFKLKPCTTYKLTAIIKQHTNKQ